MPLLLKHRRPELVECMDREDCDPVKLNNTYRQFPVINGLLCNWRGIYRKRIRPLLQARDGAGTVLDIGYGGGDVALALARWAERDGLDLRVTGIETDARAYRYSQRLPGHPRVTFRHCSSGDLVAAGERYDVVISNHVLHHLRGEAFPRVLDDARRLARHRVIFNDIERSDLGYLLFTTLTRPLFFRSYIIRDGLTSIRRSYTRAELTAAAPEGWRARRLFPFRLLLEFEADHAEAGG